MNIAAKQSPKQRKIESTSGYLWRLFTAIQAKNKAYFVVFRTISQLYNIIKKSCYKSIFIKTGYTFPTSGYTSSKSLKIDPIFPTSGYTSPTSGYTFSDIWLPFSDIWLHFGYVSHCFYNKKNHRPKTTKTIFIKYR